MIASRIPLDAAEAALTCGVTTPTTIRLSDDRTSIVEPIASFPAGRYTWTTILDGLTFKCAVAQDAIGVESTNPADWKCSSLTGIALAIDTTPPVMSNGQPTAHLPPGTTLRFFVNNVLRVSTTT